MKKITVFTSNQPRHISLINELSKVANEVFAIIEANTVHPGEIQDFYKKSIPMQNYFSNVIKSERKYFGDIDFLPKNVRPLILRAGDLSLLDFSELEKSLDSDLFLVFGASYIKGGLIDFLIEKKAINIHMGVSPYYRGSSCNFWALKNKDYQFVGSTIHMLGRGLDSGDMLFHALPSFEPNPFDYTMKAVKAAHVGIIESIKNNNLFTLGKVSQNRDLEISYTKNSHFDDKVVLEFQDEKINLIEFQEKIETRNLNDFLNPFIF